MSQLRDQFPRKSDEFHHAYFIRGSAEGLLDLVEDVFGITAHGHPDLSHYSIETFSIDEARAVRLDQSRKPIRSKKRVFVIEANTLTREAQNALLKVFEDPASATIFFLVVPSHVRLLPTLQSRVQTIMVEPDEREGAVSAEEFLAAAPAKRLTLVAPIIEAKDKTSARAFLDAIECRLADTKQIDDRDAVHDLFNLKQMLDAQGSSIKLILEFAALRLPVC